LIRLLIALVAAVLPRPINRWLLVRGLGHPIHPTARIGLSLILVRRLEMGPNSRIGHLNVLKGLQLVRLGAHASIGRNNWIYGFPLGHPRHFAHIQSRDPSLIVGDHAAITSRHLIDCTERVSIGDFSTVAGYDTQILTHSIDVYRGRQHAEPVNIGRYCFVGTDCCILGGAALPDYCVLAAKSLLRIAHELPYRVYAGVPTREVAELPADAGYLTRTRGYVD
jgi:acetyltransferase-like isoleucine patch superfamily enzyme